jgi:hypothetical protein
VVEIKGRKKNWVGARVMHAGRREECAMKKCLVAAWAAALLAVPLAVLADPLQMTAPPDRSRESVSGDPAPRDLYPHRPPVARDPHFIGPLSRDIGTGRAGVAGWTSQTVPTGSRLSSDPDDAGWLGLGFAMEWGRAPRPRRAN